MTLLALYLMLAIAAALLALWRMPQMPHYWLLLAIAAVPQLGSMIGIWIPGMFLVSVAAIFIWCLCNRTVAGVPVITVGIILNLLVMAFHGGAMPIRADVLARIGTVIAPGTFLMGSKDVVVDSATFGLFSDWLILSYGAVTFIASPGDLIVVVGIVWWLLLSHEQERQDRMFLFRPASATIPVTHHSLPRLPGQSTRPALTRLALLAMANPSVAESLLRDPLDAAVVHPHYAVSLDAHDRATLANIRSRARTVGEFLDGLADVVDGAVA